MREEWILIDNKEQYRGSIQDEGVRIICLST
jgi:hypothetical protein